MSDEEYADEIQEASDKAVIRHLDGTPNDELRELVEMWRGMSNQHGVPEPNATTLEWCAQELEEILHDE